MAQVRGLVMERAQSIGLSTVNDDDELFESGVIHSLALFRLVAQLEENFAIGISDEEIAPRNFRTIESISFLVESKLAFKQQFAIGARA